jgi:hypothetical protein
MALAAVCFEFALHVHKLPGNSQHPELYTIGVWEQTALRGVCLAQPIDPALAALRRLFEAAGQPAAEARLTEQ